MQALFQVSDGAIVALGDFPVFDRRYDVILVPDDFSIPAGQKGTVNPDNTITFSTVPTTPTPTGSNPPDIKGLINALLASPSIDQTTKNSLISALQGQ